MILAKFTTLSVLFVLFGLSQQQFWKSEKNSKQQASSGGAAAAAAAASVATTASAAGGSAQSQSASSSNQEEPSAKSGTSYLYGHPDSYKEEYAPHPPYEHVPASLPSSYEHVPPVYPHQYNPPAYHSQSYNPPAYQPPAYQLPHYSPPEYKPVPVYQQEYKPYYSPPEYKPVEYKPYNPPSYPTHESHEYNPPSYNSYESHEYNPPAPAYPSHESYPAPVYSNPLPYGAYPIQQPTITNTGETIIENLVGGIPFDCHGKPTGHYRDYKYCDIFHACVFGVQRKTYACPYVGERTFFDEATKRCEFVYKNPAGCGLNAYYH